MGSSSGIYLSLDFGETWRQVSTQDGCSVLLPSRFPMADATLFLATDRGLLRSNPDVFARAEDANREFTTVNGVKANGASFGGGGPVVAGGMMFTNSGYGAPAGRGGNVLLAFGVE